MKDRLEKVLSSSMLLIIITMHNYTNLNHFESCQLTTALDASLSHNLIVGLREHSNLIIVLQCQL
jgi:hypothetical protein